MSRHRGYSIHLPLTLTIHSDNVHPFLNLPADNYYVREGKYITEWEPEVIGQIYGAAYRNGAVTEEIRFSDISLYDQAKAYLIDEQHIRDYCEGITGLSYIEDRDQNVLILKFS